MFKYLQCYLNLKKNHDNMMPIPKTTVIEGKIVEIRDGEKKIDRSYTYGYMSLRIQAGNCYYSVLVNTAKLNAFGFLPKVGQWIRVEGLLTRSKDEMYDPSISHISTLKHIEPPKRQ